MFPGEKALVVLAECLCVVGSGQPWVMQWRASVSKALLLLLGVLVDSATRSTESLSISEWLLFKFVAGTLHCSVFSVHWQSHLLLMNGRVGRRRSPPPPPPEFYSSQITLRRWESTVTWRRINSLYDYITMWNWELCISCFIFLAQTNM